MNLFKKLFAVLKKVPQWFIHASIAVKIFVITIIAALGWFGYSQLAKAQQTAPQYQTVKVERGNLIATLSQSGSVTASNQTDISSTTNGIIQEIYVKNGDQVVAGQNLFKVKSTATPQEKAQANAAYQSALSSAQTAEQNKLTTQATLEKDRQSVLEAQNAVDYKNNNTTNPATNSNYTQLEKDSIDSTLTSARQTFAADEKKYIQADTAIAAAQASLQSALLDYQATQDSIITAPVDGTVANFSGEIGSNVTAKSTNSNGDSTSSSDTDTSSSVLVLGNFSVLSVTASINEVDIAKIKPGQKATITLDAFSGKTFVGTVTSVDTIGTSSSGVVTYNAYISFASPPADIYPGMTASAIIQIDRKDNVLSVPNSAVQTTNGVSTVRVLKEGKATSVAVETGIASDTNTEIISGVSEGETVITSTSLPTTGTTTQTTSPFSTFGGRSSGGTSKGGGQMMMIQK